MTSEAEEFQRIISESVRDMLDAYRIQASAGPVTDKALEEIIFRTAHGVLQSLAPYPASSGSPCCPASCGCCWPVLREPSVRGTSLSTTWQRPRSSGDPDGAVDAPRRRWLMRRLAAPRSWTGDPC